jgi:TPR repeat protein
MGQAPPEQSDPQLTFIRGMELMGAGKTEEALALLRQAGSNGLMKAQGTLAELLLARQDAASRTEAFHWAILAARQEDPIMRRCLVTELRPGDPRELFAESEPWLRQLARQGDPAMRFRAGIWAFNGYAGSRDFSAAFTNLSSADLDGSFRRQNPQCPFLLGYLLENGMGTRQDYAAAARMYWQAAEAGWPQAVYQLAVLVEHGQGSVQNAEAARQLYLRAAELGVPEAAYRLGLLAKAKGAETEHRKEAFSWFLQAATNGLPMAQAKVALGYEQHWCEPQPDLLEALAWYQVAARRGNRGARLKAEDLERALPGVDVALLETRIGRIRSSIVSTAPKPQPGVNLLPASVASRQSEVLIEPPSAGRPRSVAEARVARPAPTDTSATTRDNLHAGLMKTYLDDLQEAVRRRVEARLAERAKRDDYLPNARLDQLEIILAYRLCSDGGVEDVDVINTNLDADTANTFVRALIESAPLPRWTPGLRAELSGEFQDLLLAFGRKSVMRISQ